MPNDVMPLWFSKLENEDVEFIKKFILASGSLKEMARQYGVTYPTVRLRLDKLIQKIKVNEDLENEPYVSLIKRMVIDEKIDYDVAKILIEEYRKNISVEKLTTWFEKLNSNFGILFYYPRINRMYFYPVSNNMTLPEITDGKKIRQIKINDKCLL